MTKCTTGVLFWSYLIISGLAFVYGFQTGNGYPLQNAIVYSFVAGSLVLALFSGIYILVHGKTTEQESDPYEDLML